MMRKKLADAALFPVPIPACLLVFGVLVYWATGTIDVGLMFLASSVFTGIATVSWGIALGRRWQSKLYYVGSLRMKAEAMEHMLAEMSDDVPDEIRETVKADYQATQAALREFDG